MTKRHGTPTGGLSKRGRKLPSSGSHMLRDAGFGTVTSAEPDANQASLALVTVLSVTECRLKCAAAYARSRLLPAASALAEVAAEMRQTRAATPRSPLSGLNIHGVRPLRASAVGRAQKELEMSVLESTLLRDGQEYEQSQSPRNPATGAERRQAEQFRLVRYRVQVATNQRVQEARDGREMRVPGVAKLAVRDRPPTL